MNYAFGLWEKRCGSYFDTDWFNLHRVKSDSDHPNPTGQIITLHIPFTQEQTDTLAEGQPGPFYTKGVYSISFGQWFPNRKKCCSLTCVDWIPRSQLFLKASNFGSRGHVRGFRVRRIQWYQNFGWFPCHMRQYKCCTVTDLN